MKERITKAKGYVKFVEKLRVVLLCVAVPILLFIYFGQKIWGEMAWFLSATQFSYSVLSCLVIGIVIVSFTKVFLVTYHNSLVKKL
jgi:hypothetical protein